MGAGPLDVVERHLVSERHGAEADPSGETVGGVGRGAQVGSVQDLDQRSVERTDDHRAVRAVADSFHIAVERADDVHARGHRGGERPAAHLAQHEVVAPRHDFDIEIPVQRGHVDRQARSHAVPQLVPTRPEMVERIHRQ
jgi:hypothetical protein